MNNHKTDNYGTLLTRPLDEFISPSGAKDYKTKLSDEAFWGALQKYMENNGNRSGVSVFENGHIETVTELIIAHMS